MGLGKDGEMNMSLMINHELLPKEALAKISERQQSYIDEFIFVWFSPTKIEAWYANECLATWNGKGWV